MNVKEVTLVKMVERVRTRSVPTSAYAQMELQDLNAR